MDRRETPWIAAKDQATGEPARLGGPPEPGAQAPRPRSPEWPRLLFGLVIALGLGSTGLVLGNRLLGQAAHWLGRQPAYQIAFREIELVDKPPPWFKGDDPAFLESVRKAAGMPERISTLETKPRELLAAFKEAPWVDDAIQAVYALGKIQVRLVYKRPVAYVQLEGGDQFLVDARATVLAPEDVDSERLGPLVKILGVGLERPLDPRPGVVWKSAHGPDPRIVAAAKLAGFLVQATRPQSPIQIPRIIVTDFVRRGLWVETDSGVVVWWRSAPGDEEPGEPPARLKWSMLTDWAGSRPPEPLPQDDYMAFSSKGLEQKCSHPGRPHLKNEPPG